MEKEKKANINREKEEQRKKWVIEESTNGTNTNAFGMVAT